GLASHTQAASPWAGMLMTGLLLAQPHDFSAQLADGGIGAHRPPPLRRALALIERHPEEELSIERIARVAGVSARSLQRYFREHVGVPPREYLQTVRLARVHHELRAAGARDVTVTEVALRWGFTHVPRFAAAYRKHYGVPPSVTLRTG
ncbi:MAG: helix-turn-helix domain-containing protein, partial [Pseudonocardia sp.]